jgi:hypothetical protein
VSRISASYMVVGYASQNDARFRSDVQGRIELNFGQGKYVASNLGALMTDNDLSNDKRPAPWLLLPSTLVKRDIGAQGYARNDSWHRRYHSTTHSPCETMIGQF